MKLYYYCSYDGSPSGFRLGKAELNEENEIQELSDMQINPFIRRCFETGLVRSAFGKIPEGSGESKYFLIKKKLTGIKENCKYYMNIAIVCESWIEFNKLMQEGGSKEQLTEAILRSIQQDKSSEYGYCIRNQQALEVFEQFFGTVCGSTKQYLDDIQKDNSIYFTLSSSSPDLESLEQSLKLNEVINNENKEIKKVEDKVYRYGKKTKANNGKKIVTLLAIGTAICAAIAIIIALLRE